MELGFKIIWTEEEKAAISLRVRGVGHPKAKLTDDKVRLIRQRVAEGHLFTVIAAEFGVSRPTISLIAHNKIWTHVI